MSSTSERDESAPSTQNRPKRGEYVPPLPNDLRSPCPVVNALANHGYISRNGLNVNSVDIKSAMSELGIGSAIRTALTCTSYVEHQDNPPTGFWVFIRDPFAYFLRKIGLRNLNQRDSNGIKCLNLDQLSRHGAVEHDVSLSRRDFAQGDNHTPQKDLIADLVGSSSNGNEITTDDFVKLRQKRLVQQKQDNENLKFGAFENRVACGEIALIQSVFGSGRGRFDIPVSYVKALFEEERLPIREGWTRRKFWPVGLFEMTSQAKVIRDGVGSID